MADDSPRPAGSAPAAAAGAATFAAALTVSLSAPSLTDPLLPGLAFVVLFPLVMAWVVAWVVSKLPFVSDGRTAAIATSVAVALPWLLVAGAPLARHPWSLWLGLLLAAVLPLWMLRTRGSVLAALVAAVVLTALPGSKLSYGNGMLRPLVVVGMDSSNWPFIQEMIAENPDDLPALQELMRRGAWAPLESEPPTASARIWTILATGVNDKENGILNFGNRRSDLRAGRVWDSVVEPPEGEPAGTAGIVAWLINTPPPEGQDRLVFNTPGWVTGIREAKPAAANPAKVLESMGEDATNRPGFGELFKAMRSSMAVASADHAWQHVTVAMELVLGRLFVGFGKEDLIWRMKIMRDRINADVFFELSRRHAPDFGALVLYGTDQLGHFYWKYHEVKHGDPGLFPSVEEYEVRRMGEAVRDSYRACDRVLGRLMEQADLGELTLMLCSDHGMTSLPEAKDDKLLKLNGGALLYAAGGGADGAGQEMFDRFTTSNVNKALYISAKAEGRDARRHLDELRQILEEARNVTVGQPLFTLSFPENAEGSMRVDFLYENMDTLEFDHTLQVGEVTGLASELFVVETRSGEHTNTGFFLLAGPGVREGVELEARSIYDVVPTMLYVMGKAVPEDLPGAVALDAFTSAHREAFPLRTRPGGLPAPPKTRQETDDETAAENENAKKMGYTE